MARFTGTLAPPASGHFGPRGALVVERLAADVEAGTRIRASVDGTLYRYVEGVYVDDAEPFIRRHVLELLGNRWRRTHPSDVVQHFVDRERFTPLSLDPDDRNIIRAKNGIVDPVAAWKAASQGEVYSPEPYTPENATTIQIPWEYDANATCPKVDAFIREVVHEDAVAFFYELAGYALLPRNPLRKAFLFTGVGRNGKSIALHLVTNLIGRHQVSAESLEQLGSLRFSPAQLVGKLANICADIGTRAAEDSSVFKQITGGDRIRAERKMKSPFEFIPSALLIFSANEAPRSPDTSSAYFDRWLALEFPNRFEEDARKAEGLKALGSNPDEMRGFLRRSVEAAGRLLERGDFDVPASAQRAGEKFRRDVDSVAGWTAPDDGGATIGAGGEVEKTTAYKEYRAWCDANGLRALGRNKFFTRLLAHEGVGEKKNQGVRLLTNIEVVSATPLFPFESRNAEAAR